MTLPFTWTRSDPDYVYASSSRLYVTDDASTQNSELLSSPIPVIAGETYTGHVHVCVEARSSGSVFHTRINWYDADGDYISYSVVVSYSTLHTESQTDISVVAPANACWAMLRSVWAGSIGTCTAYVTGWTLVRSGSPDVVDADAGRIRIFGPSRYAWFAAASSACPLVVPGAWYEFGFTRDVDDYVAGEATAEVVWEDIDGTVVRTDLLSERAANDGVPAAVTVYAKAPVHAARVLLRLGTSSDADLTVYYSAAVLRRCPMRLILVAEDAAGACTSYRHPVHLTLRYTPRYEVSR